MQLILQVIIINLTITSTMWHTNPQSDTKPESTSDSPNYDVKYYHLPNNSTNISTSSQCRKYSQDFLEHQSKIKTQICKYWIASKTCPFANGCYFAHGETEIRDRGDHPSTFKTKNCHNFTEKGFCVYGSRCQFIHPKKFKIDYTYKHFILLIKHNPQLFFVSNKRLSLFENICRTSLRKISEDLPHNISKDITFRVQQKKERLNSL